MGPGSRWGWKRKLRTGSRWEALRARREGLDIFLVNSGEEQIWSSGGPGRGSSSWLGKGVERAGGLCRPATPVSTSMCSASLGEVPEVPIL